VKSEIVVPIFKNEKFIGEIDIDSHKAAPFTDEDEIFLVKIAEKAIENILTMKRYQSDHRIVMTLDAGGTNLRFSAIKGGNELVKPITKNTCGHELDKSLKNIISGFFEIKVQLDEEPVAISFGFPGPTDYKNGIIGDLINLPAYRGGVALGAMLEEKFEVPVFINNDAVPFYLWRSDRRAVTLYEFTA